MVTWEGGLKEAPVQDEILCRAKDNMTLLFSENGDMISMNKKKERYLQHGLAILFIICTILTKCLLAHFV
jgi:hypothetical protein